MWTVSYVTVTYDAFSNVSSTATVTAMDTIRPFTAAVVAAAAAAAAATVGVLSVAVVADTVLLVVFVVVGAIEKWSHSSI